HVGGARFARTQLRELMGTRPESPPLEFGPLAVVSIGLDRLGEQAPEHWAEDGGGAVSAATWDEEATAAWRRWVKHAAIRLEADCGRHQGGGKQIEALRH